jgi:hypothetical protein
LPRGPALLTLDPSDLNTHPRLSDSLRDELLRLQGSKLVGLGRAAGLQHFTFRDATGRELHLHTESPWRITDANAIVAGRADYWRPSAPSITEEALDAGEVGATLRDVRNEALRQWIADEAPAVARAATDVLGGLVIEFTGKLKLEIFPDATPAAHDRWEFWRLFERHAPHLVVDSSGIRPPEV